MSGKAGLYFHIPFCAGKCPYCNFYSVRYDEGAAQRYVDRLIEEIKKYDGSFDTVYFGGGTPGILEPELLGKLLSESKKQFDIAENAEVTVECNPSKDMSRDFEKYKSYGINRISLGMQSAVDKERFALGRRAGRAEVLKTVNYAKAAGIDNISLDLMLATPKQTLDSLDETFEFIALADVRHISAYILKIEEGTPFYSLQSRLALPDEDETAQMYLKTVSALKSLGFEQYEISNFAKSGFESRHNLKYWLLDEYLGIGASAHSFWGGRRFYYNNDFEIIPDGEGGTTEEKIMLGLRLSHGIDKSLVKKDVGEFVKAGYMTENGGKIALTPKGMLVSNYIISELM